MLPFGASLTAEASSRISFNRSLFASPACHLRLQRPIEGGIGLAARQEPLAYS
jgi:hypothetical protein